MQQFADEWRLYAEQLLGGRIGVLARRAPDLGIALHGTEQAVTDLVIHVPAQRIELGFGEELADLGGTASSERP
jgi:hypothetical protein